MKWKRRGCELCGWYDEDLLEALHFDHLDRETKIASISKLASSNRSIEVIDAEIDKCRLICANCHRLYTIKQLGFLDNEFMSKSEARKLRKELTTTLDVTIDFEEN